LSATLAIVAAGYISLPLPALPGLLVPIMHSLLSSIGSYTQFFLLL